ncbi:MAG: right-handed parallel beta-helix repeat-containing protein [Planctomycetes bacterium]|nr:right-handed parallel beta-helix repeat-containing protein [Planctomycetota bacterium]
MIRRFLVAAGLTGIVLTAMAAPAGAEQLFVENEAELSAALSSASDGDEILLAPGTYLGKFSRSGLTGVTIRSADPDNMAIIDANGRNEVFHFSDAVRVTLADLVLRNAIDNCINIDHGGTPASPSRDLTLRNLTVLDTDVTGNNDGIKLSGVMGFHVDGVTVDTWGGSSIDMVGCHDGLIENSLFRNGPEDFNEDCTGVRPKGRSTNITIRANRFVDAGPRSVAIGGNTGLQFFYPQPPGPVEADDIRIEGNVIVGSNEPIVYMNIDGGVIARHNFIFRPTRTVVRIHKENTTAGFVDTQYGVFTDNVVVWDEGDITSFVETSPGTLPETFTFARNQWYNRTNPGNSTPVLPSEETGGIVGIDPQIDTEGIIAWQFDWGVWLVNASETPDTATISQGGLRLATAAPDSEFDLDLDMPLVGDWAYSVAGPQVSLEAFSQAILIHYSYLAEGTYGDTDVDGDVDATDLAQIGAHWAPSGGANLDWSDGDFDFDGDVDATDLAQVGLNWNPSGTNVPEPATLLLMLAGAAVLRRRRS